MPAPPAPLAHRIFAAADQDRFADLSGDRNPLHVDGVAARRLLTGRAVVHGVHTLLSALELWPLAWPEAGWRIDADFLNPVSVGNAVAFSVQHDAMGAPLVLASVDDLPCCRTAVGPLESPRQALPATAAEILFPGVEALDRAPDAWVGQRQELALPGADFTAAFPHTCARIGERRVAAIALLSTYVGMVCPGLHSVFSTLSAEPGAAGTRCVTFEVLRFDHRLRLFTIAFDGPVRGELRAFLRAPAQPQPSAATLRSAVNAGEFAGTYHWVIGGSRGLGELVAKLAAVGGGGVTLSHASGTADAARVVQDIAAAGAGPARARHLDVLHGSLDAWLHEEPWPDAVWYFATPRIYRKKVTLFDAGVLDEFLAFYVHRFEALCQSLEAAAQGRTVRVFYPSTVFVDERPKGMTEYAMAKAAAEVLITDLARRLRHVRPIARRLPRLATDQTAGLFVAGAGSATQAMLPVMRELLAH